MPASKKPRKKRQYKVTMKGLEYWARFTTRGEGWSDSMLDAFAQDFLLPLDAIYWSRGKDPYCRSLFGRIKDKLVMSWILARYVKETEQMRRVVAEANKQLQIVFNCWMLHKRILYPELKKAREGMNTLFNTIRDAFEPWEVSTCHEQAVHNLKAYDLAENELDLQLPESWDIPVITTRREKRCLNA